MGEIIKSNKKNVGSYAASISFLIIVIIITATLHFYNNYIGEEVENLKEQISSREKSIKILEQKSSLQVYSLLELNKKVIESYELMNKVTVYIDHMNEVAKKYNLEFSGFNLSKGEIITNVKVVSDNKKIAFQKTSNFISKYRVDPNKLFELKFINSVEGMDEMKFKVKFKIQ